MPGLPFHHVAVAVPSLASAVPLYESVTGHRSSPIQTLETQGVRVCFVGPQLELLEPLTPDTGVGRFLDRSGAGLHHIAYRSDDLRADLERLAADGFELIDAEPRPGAFGHSVAFLHPRSTGRVLIELVEEHPISDP
ncbi:MAG: methylmalonyl-CoA epimerase [Gemmatimonadetes bacterium]|nr:methylmalonyl-CoA epimerase [Gemmatimonadota bacterium]NNF38993.1 methylmalonyl-CoA epimerase [Gemmatimonadota bacterium]NNK63316.1 methylmalonyl-CoA epimerase [Gemmatimonadota bacterium]